MKSYLRFLPPALLALAAMFAPGVARAQVPSYGRPLPGYTSPAVSPYLNLLRRGSDPAINYYGIVRPQIDFRSSIAGLQQQVIGLDTTVDQQGQAAALGPTGHPVTFMNYSHYFSGINGAGRAGAPAPAAGAITGTPARASAPTRGGTPGAGATR
jgi:hypothetical protein